MSYTTSQTNPITNHQSPLTIHVYGRGSVPELKHYQHDEERVTHYSWTAEQIQDITLTKWTHLALQVFQPDSRRSHWTNKQWITIETQHGDELYSVRSLNLPSNSTEEYTQSFTEILIHAWSLLTALSVCPSLKGKTFEHSLYPSTAIVSGADCYEGFVREQHHVHVYTPSKEDGRTLTYQFSVLPQSLPLLVKRRWRYARKVYTHNSSRDHYRHFGEWCDELDNALFQNLMSSLYI
jgi:hypothetical protein